eukprot:2031845-Prymnesium_polylepis.1
MSRVLRPGCGKAGTGTSRLRGVKPYRQATEYAKYGTPRSSRMHTTVNSHVSALRSFLPDRNSKLDVALRDSTYMT